MKPTHGAGSTSDSCSCNLCVYKIASDRPSVRRLIEQGSRIDKIYLEKFIPLRERKLLGKLVRTRAAYDNIRARPLSDSSMSVGDKVDLQPLKRKLARRGNDAEISSSILDVINLLDKGETLGLKVSECCSCCSCGSTIQLTERERRLHTHIQGIPHIASGSSYVSQRRTKRKRPFGGHANKIAKRIRSEPCACTSQLSELIKRESKALLNQLSNKKPDPIIHPYLERKQFRQIKSNKTMLAGVGETVKTKPKPNSQTKIFKHSNMMLSNEIKDTDVKLKQNVTEEDTEKALDIGSDEQIESNDKKRFRTRKDSLMKYRRDLQRYKDHKWDCDWECHPDVCEPEDCFKIITRRRLHKGQRRSEAQKILGNQNRQTQNFNGSQDTVQAKYEGVASKTTTEEEKILTKDLARPRSTSKNEEKSRHAKVQDNNRFCFCDDAGSQTRANKKLFNVDASSMPPKLSEGLQSTTNKSQSQYRYYTSSNTSRSIKKNAPTGSLKLKRCFCTFKIKPSKVKSKITMNDKALRSPHIEKMSQRPYEFKPMVCIPGEYIPVECEKRTDSIKKRSSMGKNKRRKTTYRLTKSVSSGASRSQQANNTGHRRLKQGHDRSSIIDTAKTKKNSQIVHISSNFSFSVEFSKDEGRSRIGDTKNDMIMKKRTSNSRLRNLAIKPSQIRKSRKSSHTLTKKKLGSCFCTRMLAKRGTEGMSKGTLTRKNKMRKLIMSTETGTETKIYEELYPRMVMATKSTNMKKPLTPHIGNISRELGTVTDIIKNKAASSSVKLLIKKKKNRVTQSGEPRKPYVYSPISNNSKMSGDYHRSSTRQVVSIGSNFSFNVKFSKDRFPLNYYTKEYVRPRSPKILKGDNYHTTTLKQRVTQTRDIKKINVASAIRPMLKRCFCTLKLHDQNKPTVMPVLNTYLKNDQVSAKINILRNLVINRSKSCSYSNSVSTISSSFKIYESRRVFLKDDSKGTRISTINFYDSFLNSKAITENNQQRDTGANNYFKSSFYALNMQVQKMNKKIHKLKPYECEPGICVPGQCNPIECQKLIMKRLMKRASTMTSTGKQQAHSISSGTLNSISKRQQYKPLPIQRIVKEHQGINYNKPSAQKQIVRVGSTFSFNIEFTKDRTIAQPEVQDIKINKTQGSSSTNTHSKKLNNNSTRGSQVLRRDRPSQSAVVMEHKGSHATPKLKRCFCTLKLQKKGRLNRAVDMEVNKELIKKHIVKTADFGQNTKKFKQNLLLDLDPNECEPNVCIPGECDPYECLEGIKRRRDRRYTKNFGTSMNKQRISSGSMTSSQKKAKQAQAEHKPSTALKKKVEESHNFTKPSRQAVRVGSSFSFNVEFSKDTSLSGGETFNTKREIPPDRNKKKNQSNDQHIRLHQKAIQDSKHIRHQNSQMNFPGRHEKSTKTDSFFKRCFCTAKLRDQKQSYKDKNIKSSASYVSKCACFLKSIFTGKSKTEKSESIQTNKVKEMRIPINPLNLDPYECEPGVCIPGECDPRICEERIKRRRGNLDKISSTIRPRTSSTMTLNQSVKTSKSAGSNAFTKSKRKRSSPQVNYHTTANKQSISPERNAVHIASNFSFHVEFHKERNPSFSNAQIVKQLKHPKFVSTETESRSIAKAKGMDSAVLWQNRKSQADPVKKSDRGSSVGPMLKRCFCTLALHKPTRKENTKKEDSVKLNMINHGTSTPEKMIRGTMDYKQKSYKLEPYECEPGICIPGQCDPMECEKLIKRRQRRDSGSETTNTSKSAATMKNETIRKHVGQNMQALRKSKQTPTSQKHRVEKKHPVTKTQNRQAVRIGSNFSFNIEFSTNRTATAENDSKLSKIKNGKNSSTMPTLIKSHKITQGNKDLQNAESQVYAKRVRSTVTEVAPFLKRCFCTLTLHKTETNKIKPRIVKPLLKNELCTPKHCYQNECKDASCSARIKEKAYTKSPVPRKTKKKPENGLDPNECEPGFCIPGQCNPQECLERIKKRGIHRVSRRTNTKRSRPSSSTQVGRSNGGSKKIQSLDEKIPRFVEQLRFPIMDHNNWQGVKLGSNISFNIEFYKERLPKAMIANAAKSINTNNATHQKKRSINTDIRQKKFDRQAQTLQTVNKASLATNALKRCFCTAMFHKMNNNDIMTVGRVDKLITLSPFKPAEGHVYPTNIAGTNKFLTTATKETDTKHLDKRKKNENDLKTILPYAPRNFNKSKSKTLLPKQTKRNKVTKGPCCARCSTKGGNNLPSHNCKSINGKNNKELLLTRNRMKLKINRLTRIFTNNYFKRKNEQRQIEQNNTDYMTETHSDSIKKSNSERCPKICPTTQQDRPKKSKSLKNTKILRKKEEKNNKTICFSMLQSGDTGNNLVTNPKNEVLKDNLDISSKNVNFVCPHCQNIFKNSKGLTVNFSKPPHKEKPQKGTKTMHSHTQDDQNYYNGQNKKNAGDALGSKTYEEKNKKQKGNNIEESYKKILCESKKKNENNKQKQNPIENSCKKICERTKKNEEKKQEEKKNKESYKKPCKCEKAKITNKLCECPVRSNLNTICLCGEKPCICGSLICTKSSKKYNEQRAKEALETGLLVKKSKKPCVCGSPVCSQEVKKMKSTGKDKPDTEQMISNTCCRHKTIQQMLQKLEHERSKLYQKEDSAKMRQRKVKHEIFKNNIKKLGCPNILHALRTTSTASKSKPTKLEKVKSSKAETKKGNPKRVDPQNVSRRSTKHLKTTGGKTNKCPAIDYLKHINDKRPAAKQKKGGNFSLSKKKKKGCKGSIFDKLPFTKKKNKRKSMCQPGCRLGAVGICPLICPHCLHCVKIGKSAKGFIQRNSPPETVRLHKDGCQMYLATMRRKPWLIVYYLCPWFYPHCRSILNIISHLTKLLLFLLAAVVWSPVVLCIEGCRFLVCCFM